MVDHTLTEKDKLKVIKFCKSHKRNQLQPLFIVGGRFAGQKLYPILKSDDSKFAIGKTEFSGVCAITMSHLRQ